MYKQLASPTTIRVLHIHPAPETDPLTCSLEHCDLDNDPEYEAISYVWGNSELTCSLICDLNVIPVTRSLREALLRVRLLDRIRTVWIDGLCINQTDNVEKSHQVQLMQRVFRNAHRVLVWLGPDQELCARKAFDICILLGQRDMDLEELETTLTSMNRVMHKSRENWYPVAGLNRCPWWERVWIIQEIALAKDLLFFWGMEEIQWTNIDLAIRNLQKPDIIWRFVPYNPGIVEPISRLSAIKDQRSYATSFMGTIHMARLFRCSDSRDRIFAILGLGYGDDRWAAADPAGRSLAEATIPDYSLPVEHVYRQFAIRALQRGLTEDIFLAIQPEWRRQWQPGDIPSWQPRWDMTFFNNIPLCHRLHEVCKFDGLAVENAISFTGSVSGRMSALQWNLDPLAIDTLNVLSAPIDRIVALSDHIWLPQFNFPETELISFWEEHIRPLEATDRYNAVMTDLCEAATYNMASENHVRVFYEAHHYVAEKCPEAIATYAKHGEHAMLRSVAQLLLDTGEITYVQDKIPLDEKDEHNWFKRFFITDRGYVGMGPAAAQLGEHVALLWNTACPIILRREDDFYRIVGGSYMAGLNRKKVEGIPHPLDDILSGKSKAKMIQIR